MSTIPDDRPEAERVRERDRERKRRMRATGRDVEIPAVADPGRRAACEADIYQFLSTYAGEAFYQGFTSVRAEIVEAILAAATTGGDQAIAAPRGEGKTTIVEWVTIYCLLRGLLRFPLICAATGPDAERILSNIKTQFEHNDLLAADFPEVCEPIRSLEGAPQRAGGQTVNGERTRMKWAGGFVKFPTVEGSLISGAVLMTRGLDAAIRGIRVDSLRPDLVIIDDPETRESAEQPLQVDKRAKTIEQDIGGLGGPQRKLARLMLCTLMNRTCLSYRYTDPAAKPSWKGRRYRLVARYPDRMDLWEEYITRRQIGQQNGDDTGRLAHQFYLDNREAMDVGSEVTNPHRFVPADLGVQLYHVRMMGHVCQFVAAGKSQAEASAIQHAFNIIADRGQEAFDTELQNDPPKDESQTTRSLSANHVQNRVNGLPRRMCPPSTRVVTCGIDVAKDACHWTATAWLGDCRGFVIDHGVAEVYQTNRTNQQAVELAIRKALHRWRESILADPFVSADGGDDVLPNLVLIDGHWEPDAVYGFCQDVGYKGFRPSFGWGASSPMKRAYRSPRPSKTVKQVGKNWYLGRNERGLLVGFDADHWKDWVHERFLTPQERPGGMSVFGDEPRDHFSFAKHIVAEERVEEFQPGKGLRRKWVSRNRNNHWLDATTLTAVGASILGIRLLATSATDAKQKPRPQRRTEPPRMLKRPGGWVQGMQ